MALTLDSPEKLGSRAQARALFEEHWEQLRDAQVVLDCSNLKASTPSFVDELVLSVLVEAGASLLVLAHAPERTARFAWRSADIRGVSDRLEIENQGPGLQHR